MNDDPVPAGTAGEFVDALDQFSSPFHAQKIAQLDVQVTADPSFGLNKKQFGWYSNDTLFDSTHFTEVEGTINIQTSATSGDTARIRTAYPGQYVPLSVAEPGVGLILDSSNVEYDDQNRVSLTHGEISAEMVEWDENTDSGVNAHGISFEQDGVYFQMRRGDQNVEFVRQENWNIDPMDGTGPSGRVFRPDNGYVYGFPFTWHSQGAFYLVIYDAEVGRATPVHRAAIQENPAIGSPNLPVQVTVENKNTAEPLGCKVGNMQYSTYGGEKKDNQNRTTEETRYTSGSYIANTVATSNNAIDPFAEPGVPLVSIRRDLDELDSRVALSVSIDQLFASVDQDIWMFIFDEYDPASALTGQTFTGPVSTNTPAESRIETDTEATDYTPSANATLRGMTYVATGQKDVPDLSGDTSARLPLESTMVITAALAQGSNATDAEPFLVGIEEGF